MPTWFIQLFGFLLLAGLLFVAYSDSKWVVLVESLFVALAMVLVGRHIAKKKSRGQ